MHSAAVRLVSKWEAYTSGILYFRLKLKQEAQNEHVLKVDCVLVNAKKQTSTRIEKVLFESRDKIFIFPLNRTFFAVSHINF